MPQWNAPFGPQSKLGTVPGPTTNCLPDTSANTNAWAKILRPLPSAEVETHTMYLSKRGPGISGEHSANSRCASCQDQLSPLLLLLLLLLRLYWWAPG